MPENRRKVDGKLISERTVWVAIACGAQQPSSGIQDMELAPETLQSTQQSPYPLRRADRRRRHLRRSAAPTTSRSSARHELRRARDAGELRRHLDHPQISRASARTATSTPSATASSPGPAPPIATAAEILNYMGEVIDENDLAPPHPLSPPTQRASWSSDDNRWTIEATRTDTGEALRFTAQLPLDVPGLLPPRGGLHARVAGHGPTSRAASSTRRPGRRTSTTRARRSSSSARARRRRRWCRRWPTTARTSPCCSARRPTSAPAATRSRSPTSCARLQVDEAWIHEIVRRKILYEQAVFTRRCFDEPEAVKEELLAGVRGYLGPDYDIDTHFTPRYRPWRQRLAFVPDGDLFKRHPSRQGLGGDRRDRALHRERASC